MAASKGTSRDFYNVLIAQCIVSYCYAQVARLRACANHVQHIGRLSLVTWCVPLGTKGQLKLLSLAEMKSHVFQPYLLAETINR